MKRSLSILLPILLLGMGVTWRVVQKRAEAGAQSQQRQARMKAPAVASLATAQIRDITRTFEAVGSVEAPLSVKIAPKITGRIGFLRVHEGDRVKRGQALVRIDASAVEAQVRQQMAAVAEARYRLAQAQLNQGPADVSVATQIRQQKAALGSAKADYNQARVNYEAQVAAARADVLDAQSKVDNGGASVKSAQANLDNAKTKYGRATSLHDKGFVSTENVDDARAALAVQQAALEVAQGQLRSANALADAAQQRLSITTEKVKADIEAARAKLTQTEASLEYAQANTAQKSAYWQSIAALQAGVAAAQASLESAKAARRDTVLVSRSTAS